jgi:ketosteroid isomerase-like protein
MPTLLRTAAILLLASSTLATLAAGAMTEQQKQVADTERAFAQTMSKRDFAGFASFVSEEAIFFSGQAPLHGKTEVTAWWKRYYDKTDAPFSWEPGDVEVLPSGTLALSSGPVRNPQGKVVATFTSIWRLEAPNTWRIIFDKGNEVCECT